MKDEKNLLTKLIQLYEKQENIRVMVQIKKKEVKENGKQAKNKISLKEMG